MTPLRRASKLKSPKIAGSPELLKTHSRKIGRFSFQIGRSGYSHYYVNKSGDLEALLVPRPDFLTNECILLPALVRKYRLVKAQGLHETGPR